MYFWIRNLCLNIFFRKTIKSFIKIVDLTFMRRYNRVCLTSGCHALFWNSQRFSEYAICNTCISHVVPPSYFAHMLASTHNILITLLRSNTINKNFPLEIYTIFSRTFFNMCSPIFFLFSNFPVRILDSGMSALQILKTIYIAIID